MGALYFMTNINSLLNHFHRREKRIKLQIEQLNELQYGIKHRMRSDASCIRLHTAGFSIIRPIDECIKSMAELQSRRAANSYLLDELYHELAGVRGNIRQLSEAKRRGNK